MNKYLRKFRQWYNQGSLRERLFSVLLGFVVIYALFTFFIFNFLDKREAFLITIMKEKARKIDEWNNKIAALNQLGQSKVYKKWLMQNQTIQKLQDQYKFLVQNSATEQWQDIIKTILKSQPNITLEQIKNFPETIYHPPNLTKSNRNIYQQRLLLVIYSQYFDTLNYLKRLEQILPNIHWDSLSYQVVNYPLAKVDLEFSILYEKPQ